MLKIGTFGFGGLFLGLPLTDIVGPSKSLLFSGLRPLQLESERVDSLPRKVHSSCHSLVSLWLQAVSQTTLRGVLSYFHVSGCSAVGLDVSGSLTLLHCLSLLQAREAEPHRLREARTQCEPRCSQGVSKAPTGHILLPLDRCFIFRGLSEQESKWRAPDPGVRPGAELNKNKQKKTSEPKDPYSHLAFFPVPLWKDFPRGEQGCRTLCAGFLCPDKQTPS